MMKPNEDVKFYDTSSLLIAGEHIFKQEKHFLISSITLQELEDIKTSSKKDQDIKQSARVLIKLLSEYNNKYTVIIHKKEYEDEINSCHWFPSNDLRILSDALYCNKHLFIDEIIFVTNDLALKNIANLYLGDGMIQSVEEDYDNYKGYKEVIFTDKELAHFYENQENNELNLQVGQYLIIKDSDISCDAIDILVWTGKGYRNINYNIFDSKWFGKVKPYKNDPYQKILFDSLINNQITLIKGPAGSGKTFLSLAYLFNALEHHDIDKIIIFCNPIAAINSAKLGYTPGTLIDKILDTQIGNILCSKIGDRYEVERLINENKLILMPFSNLRGYDTTGMKAGIYITEAQNMDITLMKLALQRIGEDCFCIIDGDNKTQVDLMAYQGKANGMRRLSKVFRGHDIYGEIELVNTYRSKIAKIAEEM